MMNHKVFKEGKNVKMGSLFVFVRQNKIFENITLGSDELLWTKLANKWIKEIKKSQE